jgi:dynein heavy chain
LPAGSSLLFYISDGTETGGHERQSEQKQKEAADGEDEDEEEKEERAAPAACVAVEKGGLCLAVDHMPEKLGGATSMFAVKTVEGPVPVPDDAATADETLLTAVEFGVLPGHLLVMLERIIKDVYMPMVSLSPPCSLHNIISLTPITSVTLLTLG